MAKKNKKFKKFDNSSSSSNTPFVQEVKSLLNKVQAKRDFKVVKRLLKKARKNFKKSSVKLENPAAN